MTKALHRPITKLQKDAAIRDGIEVGGEPQAITHNNLGQSSGGSKAIDTEASSGQSAGSGLASVRPYQPKPANTINNYFGGAGPAKEVGIPTGSKSGDEATARNRQQRIDGYFPSSRRDSVLIADLDQLRALARGSSGIVQVDFRTVSQFNQRFGTTPTQADMDATCTMTSLAEGLFQSKPRIWDTIEVGRSSSWQNQTRERDRKFAGLMNSAQQSAISFKERAIGGLLTGSAGVYHTPTGIRKRYYAYTETLKAGQYNPEVLIRFHDGTYKGIFLQRFDGTRHLTSFKAVTEKYGKDNVWLKSASDFDYMTHAEFDKRGTTFDAAEKMFCEYTGRTYEPTVFVRTAQNPPRTANRIETASTNEVWLSKQWYDQKYGPTNAAQQQFLFLTAHNHGFMAPPTMKWLASTGNDPDQLRVYSQRIAAAGFAGISSQPAGQRNRRSGPILMQTSRHTLVAVDRLPRGLNPNRVLIQNLSEKTGEYTGNYTKSLRAFTRNALSDPQFKKEMKMTEEQQRIVKSRSSSPVRSETSDSEDTSVHGGREGSSLLSPLEADEQFSRKRRWSIPPEDSDDEPPTKRAAHHVPSSPDSSDDEPPITVVLPQAMPTSATSTTSGMARNARDDTVSPRVFAARSRSTGRG